MPSDAIPHVRSSDADTGVDSIGVPVGTPPPKQVSTVTSSMALLAAPWSLCTACLLVVVLYVNIHNFSLYGTLKSASVSNTTLGDISHAHRDTARYTLLSVSVAALVVHVVVSYFLFRHAYRTLLSVSASLADLSVMVALIRSMRRGIFFFVDSVQRARCVGECGRYWVMGFSPFTEIRAAEAALNAVNLRLLTLQPDGHAHAGPAAGDDGVAEEGGEEGGRRDPRSSASVLESTPPLNSSPTFLPRASQQCPVRREQRGARPPSFADSPLSRSGWTRSVSPALELSTGRLMSSPPSLSVSADLAESAVPFQLALRRRHVALLQLSFLSYRQLVQGEAEAVDAIVAKFLSAVLLCVRRFNARLVELYADSAILSWNAFDACAEDYTQTCAQCGYWLYEHLLHRIKESESGAFFSLTGFAGHVVCGTTSEGAYMLHGSAVTVLREVPSLLELRYCRYVWLSATPPPVLRDGAAVSVRWGAILAEHSPTLGLYVMGDPPDDPGWCDGSSHPRVWHAPEWKLFGEESEGMSELGPAAAITEELAAAGETGRVSDAAESAPLSHPSGGDACRLETFYDRNHVLYQLSNTVLGESKSCVVRLALSSSGTLVAVKEIKIERGDVTPMRRRRCQREKRIVVAPGDQIALMSEVRIMEELHHTCIVGYISFQETHDQLRIVMEYVGGGNLLQFTARDPAVDGDRPPVSVLLRSVLEGIAFLHRHHILHGDIKPQNVLVPDSGPCKLADFGISRRISHVSRNLIEGTPFYMAPEATRGEASTASDVWSFGIMMAEVITGRLPYDPDITDSYLIAQFMFGRDVERHLCTPLEPAAHDVFVACTQYDPAKRKTASELLRMPYFALKARATAADTP